MKINTKKRLLFFIKTKNINISEFLRIADIKRGFLDKNKLDSSVTDITLAKIISAFPELNLIWLITGEGDVTFKSHHAKKYTNAKISSNRARANKV